MTDDHTQLQSGWIENPPCFFCAQPVMGTAISRDGRSGRGYNPSTASLHVTIRLMTGDHIPPGLKASEYYRVRQQKRQASEIHILSEM